MDAVARGRTVDERGWMKFTATTLPGAYLIEPERHHDERGFFARAWCAQEFEAHGLFNRIAQVNVSHNASKGTLRGMHYQVAPHEEAKLLRCTRGAIFDAIVDLRADSATYLKSLGVTLNEADGLMLYVPEGFAHGFQTLEDNTEVLYFMSNFFEPDAARGARWNDPAFGIEWPLPVTAISDRDAQWVDFHPVGKP